MSTLTPRYYLVHNTPNGQRFAYPTPAIPEEAWQRGQDITWTAAGGTIEEIPGPRRQAWEARSGGWIVADAPLDSLTLHWTGGAGMSDRWRKRTEPNDTDGLVVTGWEQAGDEPTAAELSHLNNTDEDHYGDNCLTCTVLRHVYERTPAPRTPASRTFDLSDWQPLPGTPDPDRSRNWTIDTPSALAVYGPHTAHLWPGTLSGFRAAVVAALKAHPIRPSNVFDHDRSGKVSVHWSVVWDMPKPRKRRDGEEGRGPFYDRVKSNQHVEAIVPEGLSASSKAGAIERWDAAVAEWVDRFLPPVDGPVRACSNCNGAGFHVGPSQ